MNPRSILQAFVQANSVLRSEQLSLLPDVVHITRAARASVEARAPISITDGTFNPRLALICVALLEGPAPMAKLQRVGHFRTSSDLLDDLHDIGINPTSYTVTLPGGDNTSAQEVVEATKKDKRRIKRLLQRKEVAHG